MNRRNSNSSLKSPKSLCDVKGGERRKATMKSSEAKGRDTEELEELYKNLQRDWNAYKQSNSTTSRRYSADSTITVKTIQLLHNSPRNLMSQLQGSTKEMIRERRKLKGRRLFEDTEVESEMVQDMSEVTRSSSSCSSEDEADGSKGPSQPSSSSSSSSPCVFSVKGEKDSVTGEKDSTVADRSTGINGGGYIVMLGGFAIALLLFAICMRSATSFDGYQDNLVPT